KSSSYFRSADIFVLASSYEGLPKVVIESLASGLKVVASGFKMKKDVPNLYYLKNLNSQELAKKILDVDKKANKYKETFSIISKYYSYDSKAQELEEIYAKML
ncbi:MAG TPA: glycosyltransferase, partial [candidate division WWE3 bacterium]|nr:glycosyltransferase [candidate division WWE3 bacterium]